MTSLATIRRPPAKRRITTTPRPFEPGTTGWTVHDLSDPDTQWLWSEGRFELVDGVLTKMPPQGFGVVRPLSHLRRILERHLDATGLGGMFYHEVDLLLRDGRVARPDMVYLTPEQEKRQRQLERERGTTEADQYRPILVAPLLIVESLSRGHEDHDRVTKREWYAEAGVPHYWLLEAAERTLECLTLTAPRPARGAAKGAKPKPPTPGGRARTYRRDAFGRGNRTLRAHVFGTVAIPLREVWGENE